MIVLALLACGSPAAPEAPPPVAPTAPVRPSMAEHMTKMAATRDGLRTALGEAYDQPVPGLDAADATRGKETYDTTCSACHGPAGKGDGPAGTALETQPADFTDSFHARYYSDAGRVHIIENGAAGTPMPAFGTQLDRAHVLDVYAYIRAFREAPATP